MSGELSLFGDDPELTVAPVVEPVPELAAAWQIKLLRELLDARGLESTAERQQVVEAAAGRSVESLKTLTRQESLMVVERLAEAKPTAGQGSSWDAREGDTWIDNL